MTKPNVVFEFHIIEAAFDWANLDDHSNEAYLDRQTGNSIFISSYGDSDEVPEDLDDTTRYVSIPDTRDFGLGSQLTIEFTSQVAPSLVDEVRDAFRRKGGFRRFKELLDRNGLLERWYEYEAAALQECIEEWCVENDIRYTRNYPTAE